MLRKGRLQATADGIFQDDCHKIPNTDFSYNASLTLLPSKRGAIFLPLESGWACS